MEGEGSSTGVQDIPQSMAFTVTFNNFTSNKSKVINSKFVKRHIRNLSLPIPQLYDSNSPPEMNGKVVKNLGNHSEGYFSSDPEEDHPKLLSKTISFDNSDNKAECDQTEEDDCDSDVASETGTYTVQKESAEALDARLTFDNKYLDPNPQLVTSRDSPLWINEWATQVVSHNQQSKPNGIPKTKPSAPSSKVTGGVSKIPSAIITRSRSTSTRMEVVKSKCQSDPGKNVNHKQEEGGDEAERHLKTTERMMEALAARLSMDSESEPEVGVTTDSSASESALSNKAHVKPTTPLCRRKSISEENGVKKTVASKQKKEETTFKKPLPPKSKTPSTPPVMNRTDTGRFSMRATNHPPSPQLSKPGVIKKKAVGGARSNSTLSSKEVEFQNWKRRKSYDPMKAAAEGKKKENRRTTIVPTVQPQPGSASVLRSASFHGTRQLGTTATLPSSSEDEDVQTNKDWAGLQAPRTSRETTPQGSRVSLCSNSSSPRARHKLEGIDNLVVTAIANLSVKLKLGSSSLLRKLRCLYDEESEKSKQLTHEIDQLELVSEPPSPHRSPSKELASTLRNLKRLDSMLKVLDEVLFDDAEYE